MTELQKEALQKFLEENSLTADEVVVELVIKAADEDVAKRKMVEARKQDLLEQKYFKWNKTYYKVISTKSRHENCVTCLVLSYKPAFISVTDDEIGLLSNVYVDNNVNINFLDNTYTNGVERITSYDFYVAMHVWADALLDSVPD